jgi:tetratricopeptide (TPR) repeat protein
MISGEAGLGKSRLTAEFRASLKQYPLNILEGQSLAYRRSISYWMFLDVLYKYLGLPPNTPQLQIRERLVRNTYLAMGSQAAEVLPFFEHLLSLPYSDPGAAERLRYLDAGQLRQQIFLAIRDLLLVESYRQPILLILDDLHWADDASLELIQFLVSTLRKAPIFIIAISRNILPGPMSKIVETAKSQLGKNFHSLQLQNLSRDQSEQLLHQLVSIPSISEQLREQILIRSAGIPFYMEEILRMLIDEGAIQRQNNHWRIVPEAEILNVGVPDTLQELILARFDRLKPAQRRVLQVASVIGKDFNLSVLSAVMNRNTQIPVEAVVSSLLEREFILPKTNDLEDEYTFRHILMSDAIYSTLLRRERSILHGQVGEAIEQIYSDRLESQIELLANHYRWSPQLDQALHYLILAGQKAARNNIHVQARQYFEAALELLPQVDHQAAQEIDVCRGLGDELVFFGDYASARQEYQDALRVAAERINGNSAKMCCALHRNIAKTHERQGDYDQALVHLQMGQEALSHSSDPLLVERAQIWNDIGWIHFRRANFSDAQELLEKALRLVEASDAYDVIASIYNRLGGVAYNQGDWGRAANYLRKSIAIRESIGDVVGLATSFNNLGLLEIEMGEFSSALVNLTRGYELKTRLGQSEGIAMTLNNLGWLRIDRGELEEAKKALDEALEMARQIGYESLLRLILKNFGKLYLASQEWEKARQVLCETTSALKELGSDDQLVDTYRLLGEAALGTGDLDAATDWSQKARDLFEKFDDENEKLSAVQRGELWLYWGMLATRTGEYEQARKSLEISREIFQDLKSRLYQGKVAYQFGELSKAQRDRRAAKLHYREAALLFQSVGAKLEEKRANDARLRI